VEETPHPVDPVRSMHPYVRNETQIVFHEPLPSFLTYAVHPVHPVHILCKPRVLCWQRPGG